MPVKDIEKKREIVRKAVAKRHIEEKRKELSPQEFDLWYKKLMEKREFKNKTKQLSPEEADNIKRERLLKKKREFMRKKREFSPLLENTKPKTRQGWRGMLPDYSLKLWGKDNVEWTFIYFAKKGLKCEFPYIFNGKRVVKFNSNIRPIGEGDVDLIEDYYSSKKDGFTFKFNNYVFEE